MNGEWDIEKYIVIDQNIRFGKPCIKGTRITVGDILQWLSEGITGCLSFCRKS
jgi:uncharacterized protein (DUF433 family)